MWAGRYWSPRFWANRYWSAAGDDDTLVLEINGVDRTSLLRSESLSYNDKENARDTANFRLVNVGASPYAIRPEVGEEVIIKRGTTKLFGGQIERKEEIEPIPDHALYVDCECVDFSKNLDRFVVVKIYEGLDSKDIIDDIFTNFVPSEEGFDVSAVNTTITLDRVVFAYKTVTECLNELSRLTGFMWFVDPDRKLQFFQRGAFAAPFSLFVGSKNYRKIRVGESREQYRNEQFIRAGDQRTTPQNEEFAGDAKRRTFNVEFRVAEEPEVLLNAGAQTVGVRQEDDDKQWYWNKGENAITQDADDTPIGSGDTLTVNYVGLFPIVARSALPSEFTARQAIEGGSGIHQAVEDDESIESRAFALEKTQGLLRRFGVIPKTVRFETDEDGLNAGMTIAINIPRLGLSGDFLIDGISARDVAGQKPASPGFHFCRYQVTALSGEHLGSWVEFFRKLADAGRNFSFNENEKLQVLDTTDESILVDESFSQVAAHVNPDTDNFTCFIWGRNLGSTIRGATWGKAPWCTELEPETP